MKKEFNWLNKHFSNNFENGEIREIGLKLQQIVESPFLNIGITNDFLKSSGKTPCSTQKLKILARVGAIISEANFINLIVGSSGLTLLDAFS